jgi:plastocyanin
VYSVPAGTIERLANGEDVAVLPQQIKLTLGVADILVIRNDDTQPMQVGPFKVEPGQSFTQQYYNRGTYALVCSIHRGEQLQIVVD